MNSNQASTSQVPIGGGGTSIGPDGLPRTGRACLACRRLKTRCDGADDPPCKRCRTGGHDCVFVESKRGKRPPRKPADASLADKFRTVEKTLSLVLESMNSGAPPDQETLQQLQASLKEGLDKGSPAREERIEEAEDLGKREVYRVAPAGGGSPSSDWESPGGTDSTARPAKRARRGSFTIATNPHPNSLSILADASLAAEIDGRSRLTGLDPKFSLSSVTEAIQQSQDSSDGVGGKMPALLSKGIVDAETAVELFRIFFDYAYIHLPVLDPSDSSATLVCSRSPFLFTVICAVASRFHPDLTLHTKCYAEAHQCFVDCVSEGESSLESVQACMILTVWTSAPRKREDRPKRAWLYFGMAVRMALELGLFRPPAFVDAHLAANRHFPNPWINLTDVSEEAQRDALNRERVWLMAFVIDRNMSAVMGRPYQIQEAKPLLIPMHPMSLPFDMGVIAHLELQTIIGQVMDTFRDRIYGLSTASDEMPNPAVMKVYNTRMDEWKERWCPVEGEPIANNLLFYFYSSKLFLNTIPLHSMLRIGESVNDPEGVSSTISAAKSILSLGHKYAELGVLRHCPDVNFLLLLYAAVFLMKVKASKTHFAQLVDNEEVQILLVQSITDCQAATCSVKHAASTCAIMLRALLAGWKAMIIAAGGNMTISEQRSKVDQDPKSDMIDPALSGLGGSNDLPPPPYDHSNLNPTDSLFTNLLPASPAPYSFPSSPFGSSMRLPQPSGSLSGTQTPSIFAGGGVNSDPLDLFLNDTHFFNSVLVSQGADGFFSWDLGLNSADSAAAGMDF